MKLRIDEKSLRLRLSGAEVRAFAEGGAVACVLVLGAGEGQQLRYSLEASAVAAVQVRYAHGAVAVLVPLAQARAWAGADAAQAAQTGIAADVEVADNQRLRILVEQDLDCRH